MRVAFKKCSFDRRTFLSLGTSLRSGFWTSAKLYACSVVHLQRLREFIDPDWEFEIPSLLYKAVLICKGPIWKSRPQLFRDRDFPRL